MRRFHSLSNLTLAAAIALALTGLHGAVAQQRTDIAANAYTLANADPMECPEMAFEGAYETSAEFIAWLQARPERMNPIADADLGAMFKAFAERQQWRKRLAAKDGAKG